MSKQHKQTQDSPNAECFHVSEIFQEMLHLSDAGMNLNRPPSGVNIYHTLFFKVYLSSLFYISLLYDCKAAF